MPENVDKLKSIATDLVSSIFSLHHSLFREQRQSKGASSLLCELKHRLSLLQQITKC